MWLRDAPIRRKLMLSVMLTSIVLALLPQLVLFLYEGVDEQQLIDRHLTRVAEVTAHSIAAALAFGGARGAEDALAGLAVHPRLRAAAVYDAAGRLLARYPPTATDLPAASARCISTSTDRSTSTAGCAIGCRSWRCCSPASWSPRICWRTCCRGGSRGRSPRSPRRCTRWPNARISRCACASRPATKSAS